MKKGRQHLSLSLFWGTDFDTGPAACFNPRSIMSSDELYIRYHGFKVPTETHSNESLMFAQDFTFKDDDIVAATYPKSGQCFP